VSDESSVNTFLVGNRFDFVVNGIGLIKQLINDDSENGKKMAYLVNSDFPSILNDFSIQTSTPVIQIATDCVYSGTKGAYDELSEFDCTDTYGLSKVEGESRSKSLMTIRCSIIGRELHSKVSLMDWFLNQDVAVSVKGFTNHFWNGVTTLEFAKITAGIISAGDVSEGTTHLIPADQVSKYDLLKIFSHYFKRTDISIEEFEAETAVNRTLSTNYPDRNSKLWANAGYNRVPTVQEMVKNYALWSS
jgi:dTDP-4-dehydrorhamnose reductase